MFLKLFNQNDYDYHYAVIPISSLAFVVKLEEEKSPEANAKYDHERDIVFLKKETQKDPKFITLYGEIEKENIPFVFGTYQLCEEQNGNYLLYKRIPIIK